MARQHLADGVDHIAKFRREPYSDAELAIGLKQRRGRSAAERGLHDRIDVAGIQSVARELVVETDAEQLPFRATQDTLAFGTSPHLPRSGIQAGNRQRDGRSYRVRDYGTSASRTCRPFVLALLLKKC